MSVIRLFLTRTHGWSPSQVAVLSSYPGVLYGRCFSRQFRMKVLLADVNQARKDLIQVKEVLFIDRNVLACEEFVKSYKAPALCIGRRFVWPTSVKNGVYYAPSLAYLPHVLRWHH